MVGKFYVTLRWNCSFSNWFAVHSGVRQGSILSPALFNRFINILIDNLKSSGIGCHVFDQYVGCILYADDVILISPSVMGLQEMLDICFETASTLNLNFNASKCHCIVFGKNSVSRITPMCLGASNIEWCTSIRYLGVYIVAGKCVSVDINPVKRSFYAACNCIFNQAGSLDEILQLTLQETYCLPVLLYAAPACLFKERQLAELNACWNTMYRRIFKFSQWESMKCFINGLGRLDLKHILLMQRLKFYKHLYTSGNKLLNNLFWTFYRHRSHSEQLVSKCLFSYGEIREFIYTDFNILSSV